MVACEFLIWNARYAADAMKNRSVAYTLALIGAMMFLKIASGPR